MQMTYLFTTYGEAYAGAEWEEPAFSGYTIVIEFLKVSEYRNLSTIEKTLERISEYGWIIPNNCIELKFTDSQFKPPKYQPERVSWTNDLQRDILFIFGAGASANCVLGEQKLKFEADLLRPPIGPGLFEKRFKEYYNNYIGVKQSLIYLQNDTNPNIEDLMEEEWISIQQNNNQAILSRHISIQYYLQELFFDISKNAIENYYSNNLYGLFAYKLQMMSVKNKRQQFSFVSFNQDILLETFLSDCFNIPIISMEDYARYNEHPFCIFKPHGSCNWGWRFPATVEFDELAANWLFENKKNFFHIYYELLGNPFNMIDWGAWGHEKNNDRNRLGKHTIDKSKLEIISDGNFNNYFPALLLPYRDKDEFIMPLKHFNAMEFHLSTTKTLAIIGWKGNEAAFNRVLLRNFGNLQRIIIVDPNPDTVKENLEWLVLNDKIEKVYFKTFEEFVISDFENLIIPIKEINK
jgi:hypothetical protein